MWEKETAPHYCDGGKRERHRASAADCVFSGTFFHIITANSQPGTDGVSLDSVSRPKVTRSACCRLQDLHPSACSAADLTEPLTPAAASLNAAETQQRIKMRSNAAGCNRCRANCNNHRANVSMLIYDRFRV